MAKKYILKYSGKSVEMSKPNSTMLVYKIPYRDVEAKRIGFIINNPFIVYILYGRNENGKDMIYVGKSKNGLSNRPTSHKDKFSNWTTCYVLTQFTERTFFNDGTIQYLEDQLNGRIKEIGTYHNTTITTTAGTANTDDEDVCDEYLEEVYLMLDALGLDLITGSEADVTAREIETSMSQSTARQTVQEGTYYFSRKLKRYDNEEFTGTMEVKGGKFILKAGSKIAPDSMPGIVPSIDAARNSAKIEDGILQEDIEYNSPSACGEFVIGAAFNGWTNWKTETGQAIDIYRK